MTAKETALPTPLTRSVCPLLPVASSIFPLLENTVTYISQLSAKEGNLSDYWSCHQKLQSAHDVRDPWVIPITKFLVPNATFE